jgi:(2R)-3-sulfolactate dehydrogenase (NADP+)
VVLVIEDLGALNSKVEIALVAISRSYHCGAAGYHVEVLSRLGLIWGINVCQHIQSNRALGMKTGIFGTNPIAIASSRKDKNLLVIDLPLSKVTRGKIMVAKTKTGILSKRVGSISFWPTDHRS